MSQGRESLMCVAGGDRGESWGIQMRCGLVSENGEAGARWHASLLKLFECSPDRCRVHHVRMLRAGGLLAVGGLSVCSGQVPWSHCGLEPRAPAGSLHGCHSSSGGGLAEAGHTAAQLPHAVGHPPSDRPPAPVAVNRLA